MNALNINSHDDWNSPLTLADISRLTRASWEQDIWQQDAPTAIFHDLARMSWRIAHLKERFPANTLHAIAIKANPLVPILSAAVKAGAGLEAASIEEVWLAIEAGCPPHRIIYDSPAKSRSDINEALKFGIWINADNEQELTRIDESLGSHPYYAGKVGLRINPLVGEGSISITSVGSRNSRFGLSIEDSDRIVGLYQRYSWLTGLHVHVGSQGSPLAHLVTAVERAFDLRNKINQTLAVDRVDFVDIGGGLPARYLTAETPPTPTDYVRALQVHVPLCFEFTGSLVSEFGRSVQASCGWVVSRVEYIKQFEDKRIAVIHVGADLFMRSAYQPESWPLRFSVLDSQGHPKTGATQAIQIVGPLCFAGDVLSKVIDLPKIVEGDFLVIHDAGAYTLSMWSHHCNRALPQVIGICDHDTYRLEILRKKQTREEISAMWSAPKST